jgi:sugar O-acyltransferase (sialic acid O-acetyltransferase NeuD family)
VSTLFLCGASNPEAVRLALRVNEARSRWARVVLLDDDPGRHGQSILGVPVCGPFSLLAEADPAVDETANLVARTTARRVAAGERIAAFGVPFAQLVHPAVEVDGARLASDTIVYAHATIGPDVWIGEGSVVFMGAVVGHGSRLGRHCVVGPNAVVNARVDVGDRVYVGTHASVLPDLRLGDDSTVAAGSAVMRHVAPGTTVIGVPAKALPIPALRRSEPPQPGVPVAAGTAWREER